MASQQSGVARPVVAAFSAESGRTEPVEFGLAASAITGAPLVVVTAGHGADAGEEPGTLTALRAELEGRGLTPDIRAVAANRLTDALTGLDARLVVLGTSHRGTAGAPPLGTTGGRGVPPSARPVAGGPPRYPPAGGGPPAPRAGVRP